MWTVLLLIVIVVLFVKNNDLKSENLRLKAKIDNTQNNSKQSLIKFCPNCGFNLESIGKKTTSKSSNTKQERVSEQKVEAKKPVLNDTEIKNTTILSVGAILVVIAAIVFLATTWETSLGIIKTTTIFFMFLVFLGSSYIADKYLNISQTSKVFNYIAMIYLPLVFISISLFGVMGDYLSIYGDGKYLYLVVSFILLSIIYYYMMNSKKELFFAVVCYISQIISVILLVLNFTNNVGIIALCLSLYILLFHYLYTHNMFYYKDKVHLEINRVSTIAIIVAIAFFQLLMPLINNKTLTYILLLVTNYFNLYHLVLKELKDNESFTVINPTVLMFIMFSIAYAYTEHFNVYLVCILFGIGMTYLVDYMLFKKTIRNSYIISSAAFILLYISSLIFKSIVPSYCIMFLFALFTLYNRNTLETEENLQIKTIEVFVIALYVAIMDLLLQAFDNQVVLPIMYFVIFVLSNLLITDKENKETFSIISIPFTFIGFTSFVVTQYDQHTLIGLIALLGTLIYYVESIIENRKAYSIISHIWLLVALYFLRYMIGPELNYVFYIVPIGCIISHILEYVSTNTNKSNDFLLVETLISFLSLVAIKSLIGIPLFIIITAIYIYNKKEFDIPDIWYFLPIATSNIYLCIQYYNYSKSVLFIMISYAIIIGLLAILYTSGKREYVLLSLISTIIPILFFQLSNYLIVVTLLMCFIAYYCMDDKYKSVYLGSIYILFTILLKLIINDLNLTHITILNIGIYSVTLLLITRTILANQEVDYKPFEYIGLAIIYFMAISNYANEADGMIFILLLLAYTIIGYNQKWTPVVHVSLAFILINVFLLTKMFWLSLPWWVYILLVGLVLIGFAIKNEMIEK